MGATTGTRGCFSQASSRHGGIRLLELDHDVYDLVDGDIDSDLVLMGVSINAGRKCLPGGRPKFVSVSLEGLIPGIQLGINSDLSKIANAVSLGLIFEPVTGLAISGAMLIARGNAPAASNGTQSVDHVFLPYVGVSVNTEFYNAVKGAGSATSSKTETATAKN